MAQDAANGAVYAENGPGDPGLRSLEHDAGSDRDNGGRTNTVGDRKTERKSERRNRDRDGCAAARHMLPADLQNLGSRTSGDDGETTDQEPPQIGAERLGGKPEEERHHGAGGRQRTGKQETGYERPPEGGADSLGKRRRGVPHAARATFSRGCNSGPYNGMHDHAGIDD